MDRTAMSLDGAKARFDQMFEEIYPALVEFIDALGIRPADHVLNQAAQYVEHLGVATAGLAVESDADRAWFVSRMAFFVGEYFAQKYGGAWHVDEDERSGTYGRIVVGQFAADVRPHATVDPFAVAVGFVDAPLPRDLRTLLDDVDATLARA